MDHSSADKWQANSEKSKKWNRKLIYLRKQRGRLCRRQNMRLKRIQVHLIPIIQQPTSSSKYENVKLMIF